MFVNQEPSVEVKLCVRPLLMLVGHSCNEIVKITLSVIYQQIHVNKIFLDEILGHGIGAIAVFYHNSFNSSSNPAVWSQNLNSYKEILKMKLKILSKLVTDKNANAILFELKWYLGSNLHSQNDMTEYILRCLYQVAKESYLAQEQIYDFLGEMGRQCLVRNPDKEKVKKFTTAAVILCSHPPNFDVDLEGEENQSASDNKFDRNIRLTEADKKECEIKRKKLFKNCAEVVILTLLRMINTPKSEHNPMQHTLDDNLVDFIYWISTFLNEIASEKENYFEGLGLEIVRLCVILSKLSGNSGQSKKFYAVILLFSLKLKTLLVDTVENDDPDKQDKKSENVGKLNFMIETLIDLAEENKDFFVKDVGKIFKKLTKIETRDSNLLQKETFYNKNLSLQIHKNTSADNFNKPIECNYEIGTISNYLKEEILGYKPLPDLSLPGLDIDLVNGTVGSESLNVITPSPVLPEKNKNSGFGSNHSSLNIKESASIQSIIEADEESLEEGSDNDGPEPEPQQEDEEDLEEDDSEEDW